MWRIFIQEKQLDTNKEICYTYDDNGNILTKSVNGEIIEYKYKEDGDQLVSFGNETFVYDVMGNPTTYRGKTATWQNVRQLKKLNNGTVDVEYTYNGIGLRTAKKVGDVTITYTYDSNDKLIKEVGTKSIEYVYGADGIIGIKISETPYMFRKNVFGDVTHIYDSTGALVGKYSYTAFGECVIELDTNNVASDNPIRYRGYYYDADTKLYYLKSRYYDPELGRFMTIDGIEYLDPDTINGLNLYAYCGNNPVMNVDPNGNDFWSWLLGAFAIVATAVGDFFATYGAAIGAGALAILVLAGGIVGSIFTGGLAGAAILGAGIGFFGGVASNMAIQASNNGLANMDFGAAMKSAVIGAFIGAVSGAISFGFGTIGSFYGQMAGNALSNMTIAGLNVGSAFSYLGGASLFSAIGTGAGYLLGSFVGSALGNELMNSLFGYNPSTQENVSEGVAGWIIDGLMKFLGKLFGR